MLFCLGIIIVLSQHKSDDFIVEWNVVLSRNSNIRDFEGLRCRILLPLTLLLSLPYARELSAKTSSKRQT